MSVYIYIISWLLARYYKHISRDIILHIQVILGGDLTSTGLWAKLEKGEGGGGDWWRAEGGTTFQPAVISFSVSLNFNIITIILSSTVELAFCLLLWLSLSCPSCGFATTLCVAHTRTHGVWKIWVQSAQQIWGRLLATKKRPTDRKLQGTKASLGSGVADAVYIEHNSINIPKSLFSPSAIATIKRVQVQGVAFKGRIEKVNRKEIM